MIRCVLAAVLVGLAVSAGAQGVDAPLERYREAAGFQQLGVVLGRAYHERRKPTAADEPLSEVAVTLVPRSETWLFRLQAIKRESRDSVDAYREAAKLVRASRDAYEKRLLEAGAGDLAQAVTVDSEGSFSLEGIPAGPWILFAWHQTYVNKAPRTPRGPPRNTERRNPFLVPDKLAGYHVVTYWLRELTVTAGAPEVVELNDRNAWFTGVTENRQPPPQPTQPTRSPR